MNGILVVALGALAVQRVLELAYARRTGRQLEEKGARAVRPDGYAAIVAVHVLFFAGCLLESAIMARDPFGPWTIVGASLFVAGQGLRYWSMHALGPRWSTRVYVTDEPLVTGGPYRFLRHPIYMGVTLEIVGFALAFGLWVTMAVAFALNVAAVLNRIRIEDRAWKGRPAMDTAAQGTTKT
jgi:methyltransferase